MRGTKEELAKLRFTENRNYGGEGDIKILAEDKINIYYFFVCFIMYYNI